MALAAKVITVSDGVVEGTREDRSGAALDERLTAAGYEVVERIVTADGRDPVAVDAAATPATGSRGSSSPRVGRASGRATSRPKARSP